MEVKQHTLETIFKETLDYYLVNPRSVGLREQADGQSALCKYVTELPPINGFESRRAFCGVGRILTWDCQLISKDITGTVYALVNKLKEQGYQKEEYLQFDCQDLGIDDLLVLQKLHDTYLDPYPKAPSTDMSVWMHRVYWTMTQNYKSLLEHIQKNVVVDYASQIANTWKEDHRDIRNDYFIYSKLYNSDITSKEKAARVLGVDKLPYINTSTEKIYYLTNKLLSKL